MWNLMNKRENDCERLRGALEEFAADAGQGANVEELLTALPEAQRAHAMACADCREAARELVDSREIFKGYSSYGELAGPWFATRVMAAIGARERSLALPLSPWSAVPKLASRLVWVSAIVFLAAGTWLYEKPVSAPPKQASVEAAPESLFEVTPTPPPTHDEVLVSLAERQE